MSLTSPLELVYEVITWFFTQEITQDGLLNDVEMFLSEANTKDHIRAPLLWFDKQEITVEDLFGSEKATISVPFNIVCAVDIVNDIAYAESETLNLASRCVTTLYKNFLQNHPMRKYVQIIEVSIDKIAPNGTFQILNKTKLLPAARVEASIRCNINWMLYLEDHDEEVNYAPANDKITGVEYDTINIY